VERLLEGEMPFDKNENLPPGAGLYVVGGATGRNWNPIPRDFPLVNRMWEESDSAHLARVVRLVEQAMAAGGTHLLVPREHADWLGDHSLVAAYFAEHHELVEASAEWGIVFALHPSPWQPAPADLGAQSVLTLDEFPVAFDPVVYRELYPDTQAMNDDEARAHYWTVGVQEGRRAHLVGSREELRDIAVRAASVLEIGSASQPFFVGHHVRYAEVVEVVSPTGEFAAATDTVAVVASSHVIQRHPNLVKHLQDVSARLKPGGFYVLWVPDKRYCFEHFLPESTVGDMLEAFYADRRFHTLKSAIDQEALRAHNDSGRHWQGDHGALPNDIAPRVVAALQLDEHVQGTGEYVDRHAWQFTPDSFRLILHLLAELELTDLRIARVYNTLFGANEFWVVLHKPADGASSANAGRAALDHERGARKEPPAVNQAERSTLLHVNGESNQTKNWLGRLAANRRDANEQMPLVTTLGIGIITRNRLSSLQRCIAEIQRYTVDPFFLVIADDGSEDGTVAWARDQGIPVVTGPRRGVVWNKNRALYFLQQHTRCDPILLLEDDAWPVRTGWDRVWTAAAMRWHHVNFSNAYNQHDPKFWPQGSGTSDDPYQSEMFGGQCSVTTRQALAEVGFLNSRFKGYGWGHVEWTYRYRAHYSSNWGIAEATVPCLNHGILRALGNQSSKTIAEREANRRVFEELQAQQSDSAVCDPWQDEEERLQLQAEVSAAFKTYRNGRRNQLSGDHIALDNYRPPRAADPGELLQFFAAHANKRLEHHNGPPLVMYTDGSSPWRALVSLLSMILNGYAPREVLLFGEHQWDQRARDLFVTAAPFANIVSADRFTQHIRACGGPQLAEMAKEYWFVAKALFALTYAKDGCFMDDDMFIIDGVDDALLAFRVNDLVYIPGVDQEDAFRTAWRTVRSVPRPLDTKAFNSALYWLNRFVDPSIVVSLVRNSDPGNTPRHIWDQGLFATLYAMRCTAQLSKDRYFACGQPSRAMGNERSALRTVLLEYDYAENPKGIAGIHFGSFTDGLSDDEALRLAPAILGRSTVVRHPVDLDLVNRGENGF
jgi:hypothetical protein